MFIKLNYQKKIALLQTIVLIKMEKINVIKKI